MKNFTRNLSFALLLLCSFTSLSQVTVAISGMTYISGTPISNCGNIDFGTNSTVRVQFGITLTKPANQVVGNGELSVYTIGTGSRVQRSFEIVQTISFDTYYAAGADITMSASEFNASGGTLFAVFKSYSNVEYNSCNYTVTKTLLPVFNLSPTSTQVACGSTSGVTFTVTNVNNSPGTLSYNWSASGWKRDGVPVSTFTTTTNSVVLVPNSLTALPSNVSVTPVLNSVAQPTKTSSVTRTAFTTTATVSGNSSICGASDSYSIANLPTGATVSWSSSNTSVATIGSTTSTTATVNKVGNGSFNLIATITNACGQSATVQKAITTYTVTSPLPVPSGYFEVDFIDCNHDGALPITFYPDVAFGGTITLTPAVLPHPTQTQNRNITVRYFNPCTGATTSKVITFHYQAPCDGGRAANNTTEAYSIYPNTANDVINIELVQIDSQNVKSSEASAELFDMTGIKRASVKLSDVSNIISVAGLPKGVYLLKINVDGKMEDHRVIVE